LVWSTVNCALILGATVFCLASMASTRAEMRALAALGAALALAAPLPAVAPPVLNKLEK